MEATQTNPIVQATAYVMDLAKQINKIELTEFFTQVHLLFYSDIDIRFMGYFMELTQQTGFMIHHSKLFEYGVATRNEAFGKNSSMVNNRLHVFCM